MSEKLVPKSRSQYLEYTMKIIQRIQEYCRHLHLTRRKSAFAMMPLFFCLPLKAKQVNGLTAKYRNGQTFLTWTNNANSKNYYKVYRSLTPILHGAQLAGCEYLGWVPQKSAVDNDLTAHFKQNYYLTIDSGGTPLATSKGLMVATTLVNGNYYYAVTILFNGSEDTTILYGINSLVLPVAETVKTPQPVFQKTIFVGGNAVELYANFISFKISADGPSANAAGFLATDFLLYRNNSTGHQPLVVKWHGGGNDFFAGITQVLQDEINLNIEQLFPSGEITGYWGGNSGYNIYKKEIMIPSSGINYNYFQERYKTTVDWAIRTLDIDSNRIYYSGSSAGACGAILSAITYPEKVAAVTVSVPCFNVGFEDDSIASTSFNPGGKNRVDVDRLLGLVSTNLPSNLGDNTFDVVNCAWLLHKYKVRDLPPVYAVNGKMDSTVGWTEKTVYYDSVTANAAGGYYFWDQRSHGADGALWSDENFDLFRYRRNVSYPAFSNNSLDEDPGIGNQASGDPYGSVNGSLDWAEEVSDSVTSWKVSCFVRNLQANDGSVIVYPDSGVVTITPRRLQQFRPPKNTVVLWKVLHRQQIIQSGSLLFDGGLITIDGIRIFKDTMQLQLQYSVADTLYEDLDHDSYGNAGSLLIGSPYYEGYVSNHDDCNDQDASTHPMAAEWCNGIDDNCNNIADEGTGYRLYADADADGFGNLTETFWACDAVAGYVADSSDCNDNLFSIHPGATEICNNLDDNCDGINDENAQTAFFADADADGYGSESEMLFACSRPDGYSDDHTDCNDADAAMSPGAAELCNGIDDNCNTQTDEGLLQYTFYADDDADGYGIADGIIQSCNTVAPAGYSYNAEDCNDLAPNIFPGALEVCNSLDDDCDAEIDEYVVPSVITPAGTVTICAGNSQLLQVDAGTAAIYQWLKDGSIIYGATNDNYVATADGVYSVVVTSGNCSQVSLSTTVNSKALPKSTITPAGTIKACPDQAVLLNANTGNGFTYQWMNESLPIAGATNSDYSTAATGSYTVMVTNNAGCIKASPVTTIQQYAAATAKITVDGSLNICNTGSVLMNVKVKSGYAYQWYLNNAVIDGATDVTFTATAAGKYKYLAITENGCSEYSGKKTVTGCRLEDFSDRTEAVINVYPNPADGIFYVDLQIPQRVNGEVVISLFNSAGQTVYTEDATVDDGFLHASILPGTAITTGTYLLKLVADQVIFSGTVVIINGGH